MARHSNVLPGRATRAGGHERYTPQRPELRTRRAPSAPLWAKLCIAFGTIFLLISGTAYAGFLFMRR